MEITIVNISQGPSSLNQDALTNLESGKLEFNVTARLRYTSDSDYVGFQIDLLVMQDQIQVFKSGFLVGLAISNWAKDLQSGLDLNTDREKLQEISKTAWQVATGIVALQSSTNDFPGIILPNIDYAGFSRDIVLVPRKSE